MAWHENFAPKPLQGFLTLRKQYEKKTEMGRKSWKIDEIEFLKSQIIGNEIGFHIRHVGCLPGTLIFLGDFLKSRKHQFFVWFFTDFDRKSWKMNVMKLLKSLNVGNWMYFRIKYSLCLPDTMIFLGDFLKLLKHPYFTILAYFGV